MWGQKWPCDSRDWGNIKTHHSALTALKHMEVLIWCGELGTNTDDCQSFYDCLWPNLGANCALQTWKTKQNKKFQTPPAVFDTNKNTFLNVARPGMLESSHFIATWVCGCQVTKLWAELLLPSGPHIPEGIFISSWIKYSVHVLRRAWTESLHWEMLTE